VTPDQINSFFEVAGALLTWMNVKRVWQDRGYAGIYMPAVMLFTAWGFWNLWFYSHLAQTWSVAATVVMVSANSSWVGLMLWFGRVRK
jgi:hypothetical protein